MKKVADLILAARYARAFGNTYQWSFSSTEYQAIAQAIERIKYWVLNQFFNAATGNKECQQQLITATMTTLQLPSQCRVLLELLVADKRIGLLQLVFLQFIQQFDEYHAQEHFVVITAQPLLQEDTALIKQWLAMQCQKKISITVTVDPSLSAGMIMQSRNYRWAFTLDGIFADARQRLERINYAN
ncbi:F0F1 ATP synthase subunit delta [Candidatus Dependentiae bacterium]|nr:F0F1 ATP synthase subunit delta [Candidatus Dependentiae bacterium]